MAFLAIGWTTGSQIVSRLLDRMANVDAMVGGVLLTLPSLALAALLYTDHAPVALVYGLSFMQGLGIGTVTNATVSLLQRTADPTEMGRASSAHQFMRQLGGTLGTAVAGAVLFGTVASRLGSVEPVRRLLDGDDIEVDQAARSAIAAGFRGAAAVACGLTFVGLVIAIYVRRRFRSTSRSDSASTATQPSANGRRREPTH